MDITLIQLIFRASVCLYGGLSLVLMLINAKKLILPPFLEQCVFTLAWLLSITLLASGISFITLDSYLRGQ